MTNQTKKPEWEEAMREKIDGIDGYNYSDLTNEIIEIAKKQVAQARQSTIDEVIEKIDGLIAVVDEWDDTEENDQIKKYGAIEALEWAKDKIQFLSKTGGK